jgi:BCCT family betaine/carnitine transporter
LKTASLLASVPLIVIFTLMMISFLIILGRDRIKLERRADKHKEIERRSLRALESGEIFNYFPIPDEQHHHDQ